MTTYDILIAGQSLALPYTDTGDVPAPLKAQVASVLAWTDIKWQGTDQFAKVSPYRPMRQKRGPGASPGGLTPTLDHRNMIGGDAAMVGRLLDLGHTVSGVIQVGAGGTFLVDYWLPPLGAGWVRQTRAWDAAKASSRHKFDPSHQLIYVWDQGESDCTTDAASAAYGANLATHIAAVRAYWSPRVVKCLIAQVSSTLVFNTSTQPRIDAVRAAEAAFVAGDGGRSALVDRTPFATFDNCHNTQQGSIDSGVAFANAIVLL